MRRDSTRPLTAWVPQKAAQKLRIAAAKQDISRHQLLLNIIAEWIERQGRRVQKAA